MFFKVSKRVLHFYGMLNILIITHATQLIIFRARVIIHTLKTSLEFVSTQICII